MRLLVPPLAAGALLGSALTFVVIASAAPIRARFENGRLWLSARETPASEVFSALADRTGIKIVVDKELEPESLTVDIDGLEFERAIDAIVNKVPDAAGHTVSYTRNPAGVSRPTLVMIFGAGKSSTPGTSAVYEAAATPGVIPTPDLEERMERMIEAGVPRATAEKVIELTREVQKLQATPVPGAYSPDDLSPESREQLQPLIDRGVPMERAVQMLLLQERYQETLKELSQASQSIHLEGVPLPPPTVAPEESPP